MDKQIAIVILLIVVIIWLSLVTLFVIYDRKMTKKINEIVNKITRKFKRVDDDIREVNKRIDIKSKKLAELAGEKQTIFKKAVGVHYKHGKDGNE